MTLATRGGGQATAAAATSTATATAATTAATALEKSGGDAIHVVKNHNQQRDYLASNFIGSTSYLALNYDPPLGPFSEYFAFCIDFIPFHIYTLV